MLDGLFVLPAPDDIWLMLSILLKLGVVLLLIFAMLSILRRFYPGQISSSSKKLSTLETLYLSPKQKIHLVRVLDKVLLVGATDTSLTILSEIDSETEKSLLQEVKDTNLLHLPIQAIQEKIALSLNQRLPQFFPKPMTSSEKTNE